jgi:hypothetical protein
MRQRSAGVGIDRLELRISDCEQALVRVVNAQAILERKRGSFGMAGEPSHHIATQH